MDPLTVRQRATFACGGQRNNEIIPAIPTEYRGIQFKSRLEARFAEWLDKNDAGPWFYEWEEAAICDEGGYYLPDFYLELFDLYVEVKPETFINEMRFHRNLIERSGVKLVVVDNVDREWRSIEFCGAILGHSVTCLGGRIKITRSLIANIFQLTPGLAVVVDPDVFLDTEEDDAR